MAGFAVFAASVLTLAQPSGAARYYELTPLSDGDTHSYATAINRHGQVVGYMEPEGSGSVAVIFSDGSTVDLGSLLPPALAEGRWSYAYDVNDSGDIVGVASAYDGAVIAGHAFLYRGGSMQDLGAPLRGSSVAHAINAVAHVVGGTLSAAGVASSVLWDPTLTVLPKLDPEGVASGAPNVARGINASGAIVGESGVPFILAGGEIVPAPLWIGGINDSGDVVGSVRAPLGPGLSATHAAIYRDGGVVDVHGPPFEFDSWAEASSDTGEIVGSATGPFAPTFSHGFVYREGAMHDLNLLLAPGTAWVVTDAIDVNDSGQIAAVAWPVSGAGPRAVRLEPRESICGNGQVEFVEECDDANSIDGDECETDCTLPVCGNAILDVGEECDDGDAAAGDGCDPNCTESRCGNGVVAAGEACDAGEANGTNRCCAVNCTLIDGDGDGMCDAVDPCTNPSALEFSRVGLTIGAIRYLRAPRGLRVAMKLDPDPARQPFMARDGVRLYLATEGAVLVDETVPGSIGWRGGRSRARWARQAGPNVGAIAHVSIRMRRDGRAALVFQGTIADALVPTSSALIKVSATLAGRSAVTPQCGDTTLRPDDCVRTLSGRLRCKRRASGI